METIESYCGGGDFFNLTTSWYVETPQFSRCFMQTALSLVPTIFIWILTPIEALLIASSPGGLRIGWNPLNTCRLLSFIILIGLSAYETATSFIGSWSQSPSDSFTPLIELLSVILATILLLVYRVKGITSSGVVWIYILLTSVGDGIIFSQLFTNTNMDETFYDHEQILFLIRFPVDVVAIILCSFADPDPRRYLKQKEPKLTDPRLDKVPCPRENASFPSRLTFSWFNSMAKLGQQRDLVIQDLHELPFKDQTHYVTPIFEKCWKQQSNLDRKYTDPRKEEEAGSPSTSNGYQKVNQTEEGNKPGVISVVTSAYGWLFLLGSFLKLAQDILQFCAPHLLGALIDFISDNTAPLWHGLLIVLSMFLASNIQSLFLAYYFEHQMMLGYRIRTGVTALVYRKSLKLANSARREATVGEIVNLMSVDTTRFTDFMIWINLLWSCPFQIVLSIYFIYRELGISVFAGVAVMVIMIPMTGMVATRSKKLQQEQMKQKDERVKGMSEILNGIRVIKVYGWEKSFMKMINDLRDKEVRKLVKLAILSAVAQFLWVCAPVLVALFSFSVYVLIDEKNVLDAKRAFVSLTLFNLMRFPLTVLPNMITSLITTAVSVKRVNRFLNSPELMEYVTRKNTPSKDIITINGGTFVWEHPADRKKREEKEAEEKKKQENKENKKSKNKNKNGDQPNGSSLPNGELETSMELDPNREKEDTLTLKDITMKVPAGSMVAIVGAVGSGKSSLLSAILGEMECLSGTINISDVDSIAYVPQQAWIQNETLKNNILFGQELNDRKYQNILRVCQLIPDLEILQAGDETEIGEKGINLSGGQKQRVSIARACYSESSLYLMDDPLSAVDAHVSKYLFDGVLSSKTGILKGKTRILVTNNLSLLPNVDCIYVMKGGKITEQGSYSTLMDKKGDFADFVTQFSNESEMTEDDEDIENQTPNRRTSSAISGDKDRSGSIQSKSSSFHKDSLVKGKNEKEDKLIEAEKAETGKVKLSVYIKYFRSISFVWSATIVLGFMGQQVSSAYSSYWLSLWSIDEAVFVNGSLSDASIQTRNIRLSVYAGLGFIQSLLVLGASFALAKGTIEAAVQLHRELLYNIMRSPMNFFDTTPIGRIVNRFSKDVDVVDATIPQTIRSWISCFLTVITTFAMIGIATPYFLVCSVPIMIVYYIIQMYYVPTSRQLKRLESITRSPIYSHFGETLTGAGTIRAYAAEGRFNKELDIRIDHSQATLYCSVASNRWLSVRLEGLGNCIICIAALFAVFSRETIDPGLAGLSVSYAISVIQTLSWLVRTTSDIETNIVSVERMLEYCNNIQEQPWDSTAEQKPGDSWPDKGNVRFSSYGARYRDGLPLVLKNINIDVKPGEKIGIVGRTGAGKSTITLSLFRLIEAAEGAISVDGVNIRDMGLHDLRSRITIIPQDPVLFSGTLRFNLDPFEKETDSQLWKCLEHAHLKTFVKSLDAGLDHKVAEGGENLSLGQRQLICLARALLRKSKILVLDEATAAVDLETDSLIQTTIRQEFSDCTILTIAHRIHTIMDSTRILVLDQGSVIEFDTPSVLLANKNSVFSSLTRDAGIHS